jgi:hypothetical protein
MKVTNSTTRDSRIRKTVGISRRDTVHSPILHVLVVINYLIAQAGFFQQVPVPVYYYALLFHLPPFSSFSYPSHLLGGYNFDVIPFLQLV